ncbi:MAG: RagB/SusD family nutrient uptake outer membrane protein [Odoribacter sp.]|nr:RagB/SusD family nutrient uptake outer membrane protein [Odoribacter sp.]MDY3033839.1 RagB/SusD family nutrient uptake outer membrane protein [Odoribacter sp.]
MRKIIYLFVYLELILLTSCQDWFDVSPKSEVKAEDLFQKESGFRDVLTGVYALIAAPESYGRQLSFGYVDVLAQYYTISANAHEYIKTKDYLYSEPYDKEVLQIIWSRQYKAVANLNAMLMFIDEKQNVFSSDEVYKIYKGEALALRGMLHFDLLRLFAASPLMGVDRKAIPYLDSYTNIPQRQQTIASVLEKVVADLNDARDLMREVDPYGPNHAKLFETLEKHPLLRNRQKHLNYYATTALLARVQLYAGNKERAFEAVKEIIGGSGNDLVEPFKLAVGVDKKDRLFHSEWLFVLEEKLMKDHIDKYFGETVIKNGVGNSSTALKTSLRKRDQLFEQQNPADNDYRLSLWFQETSEASSVMLAKYLDSEVLPMIHLSELYYIAAECAPQDGLKYLNVLRAHRGLASIVETSDLQNEITKEYSKEFMGEGQMFYYYKRLLMTKIGVYSTVSVVPENVYVIPFPDAELDFGLIE